MNCIFERSDFTLCVVPVPEGYPQSQTHAGVGLLSNGQYVLTTSPYPAVRYTKLVSYLRAAIRKLSKNRFFKHPGEYYENPCIYVGEKDCETPSVRFHLAQPTPLMGPLSPLFGYPSFNSDPDLFIEDDKVYVLNRSIYRQEGRYNYYMRLYLIEGRIENGYFLKTSSNLLREGKDIVGSQCLTKYRGNYILTDVMTNSYNDGHTFKGIRYLECDSIDAIKNNYDWKIIKTKTGDLLPWHMSLFQYNNTLYTIIACVKQGEPQRCWQMLGKFDENLSELKIYGIPLTDYNSYRSAALVKEDGTFVLYNTTVRERIKGGTSVDGREILMAQMPFDQLLTIINNRK